MADRFFEDADVARNYQDYRPSYAGLGIERKVMSFIDREQSSQSDVKVVGELALDVGCGNGQLTKVLAPLFTKIIGVDCSEEQIKKAREVTDAENIEYRVNTAENLSFATDGSVDFVSCAAAMHYFDIPSFLVEVDRVLKPGGSFLVLNFDRGVVNLKTLSNNEGVNKKCMDLIAEVLGKCFEIMKESSVKLLVSGEFPAPPYPDKHYFRLTTSRQYNDIDSFVGFLISSGLLHVYNQLRPEEGDQIEKLKQRLLSILAEISSTPEMTPVVLSCPFNCTLYRKPLLQCSVSV